MKTGYRRNLVGIVCAALTIALAGCTAHAPSSGQQAEESSVAVLRVGVTPNAPPLVFKQNGMLTGLEPAFALKLGSYMGREVAFVEIPWEQQLSALNEGKTDIVMSAMTITMERSYLVDFTTPYMRSGQIMLIRMEDARRFSSGVESVMNTDYRIGTVSGTTGDYFVTSTFIGADKTAFSEPQQAVDALIGNTIDVFIYDAPMVCYFAAKHQVDRLMPVLDMATEEYLGWAVRKSDKDLLREADAFLEEQRRSGLLREELKYWIPYLYR